VDSFARWPLALKFFNGDVYRAWDTLMNKESLCLREGLNVSFDPLIEEEPVEGAMSMAAISGRAKGSVRGGAQAIDISYGT
jgi:hypothetical protein